MFFSQNQEIQAINVNGVSCHSECCRPDNHRWNITNKAFYEDFYAGYPNNQLSLLAKDIALTRRRCWHSFQENLIQDGENGECKPGNRRQLLPVQNAAASSQG
eukprot:m.332328 g.332328  ORF g.332328 m.332328 type:complete len:103 (-) comp16929_c0_seq1:1307-1615(-)